ncbi:MAG: carbamate kinase [Bacteroidetes bacterium]|nr:carbamate kinase [Bacteroidota bacterium]
MALGGNALIDKKHGRDIKAQKKTIDKAIRNISSLFKKHLVIITHGNGYQVGELLLQNEIAHERIPVQPLDILDAETQGELGYLIEQSIMNELQRKKIKIPVVAILTQVLVNKKDRAFKNPSKPIGSFYNLKNAAKLVQKGYKIVEDSGRGYRRVVPSPLPIKIIEEEIIKKLVKDAIVIAAGGGGIPVYKRGGKLIGLEAVIDKDLTSSCLAKSVNASILLILTGVNQVSLNYGKMDQRDLRTLTVKECRKYLLEKQFPKGSMGPKIRAAIDFLENGGKKVIITSPGLAEKAIKGKAGTLIVRR